MACGILVPQSGIKPVPLTVEARVLATGLPVKIKVLVTQLCLFATPWAVAHQAPLSMEFSRQGYWSGLPFPSTGDLPDQGIEPGSPALQVDSLLSESQGKLYSLILPVSFSGFNAVPRKF